MPLRLRLDPRLPICLLALLYAAWMARQSLTPLYDPDSASYIAWSSIRTMGYPLYLRLFGVSAGVVVQPLIYAAATLVLCLTLIGRRPGWPMAGWALLLEIGLLGNPELNKYHAFIMTESLFFSLMILWMAAALRHLRRPDWQSLLLASVLAGLAGWVRPTAYMMPAMLAILPLLTRRGLKIGLGRALLVALLPMLLMVAFERGVSRFVQGPDAPSLAGRHFFAKAALVDSPADDLSRYPDDPVRQRLQDALSQDYAPVRELLRQTPTASIHNVLHGNYEICIEYSCSVPFRTDLQAIRPIPETEMNKTLLQMGLKRLASNPLGYLMLTLDSYQYMWVLYSQSHPALMPGFIAFVGQHRPLPFEDGVSSLVADYNPSRLAVVGRPLMIAMGLLTGILSLFGLIASCRGRAPGEMLALAMTGSLLAHGGLFFTAMLGIGCPRYTIGFWPVIVLSGVCFAIWTLEQLRNRLRRS